jgi:hypothetical protein
MDEKICLSITDSYDEIMDFIFPPNLFFYDEFRVNCAWNMFLSQLKVLHWCSPASSVGTDGWKRWWERMEKLVQIQDWYP